MRSMGSSQRPRQPDLLRRLASGVALVAVVAVLNVVVVFLLSQYPVCPEKHVAFIADKPYCTSFRWSAANYAVIEFACALGLLLLPGVGRAKRWSLANIPILSLLLCLVGLTREAQDRAGPECADKVEYQSTFDIPATWLIILGVAALVQVFAWRRRTRDVPQGTAL
jgi:hypothetical protein